MVVGAFGDFVFGVSGGTGQISQSSGLSGVTFNALTQSTQSRLYTHTTLEGLPIVEFAGLDADRVTLTGTLNESTCGDVDDRIEALRNLQAENLPRMLTRGDRVLGTFLIESLSITEERWAGNGILVSAAYSLTLIATRPTNG